jgi:hypothetical protein
MRKAESSRGKRKAKQSKRERGKEKKWNNPKIKETRRRTLGARNFWALGKKEIALISIAKSPYYPTLFSI